MLKSSPNLFTSSLDAADERKGSRTGIGWVIRLGRRPSWRTVVFVRILGGSVVGFTHLLGAAQQSRRRMLGVTRGAETCEVWRTTLLLDIAGCQLRRRRWLHDPLFPTFTCDVELLMAQKSKDGVDAMTNLPGLLVPSAGSLRTLPEVTAVYIAVRVVRLLAQEYGWQFHHKGACAFDMLTQKPRHLSTRFFTPILNSMDSTPVISFSIFTKCDGAAPSTAKKRGSDAGDTNTQCLIAPMRKACSVSFVTLEERTEQRRNVRAGETGDPRENPPTSCIVRHNSHMLKSRGYLAGDRTRWNGAGKKGRGKREITEKTHQPTASTGMIPTCENPGIEPGSPWWEASVLIARPP
ncbi:hypothetical protein PR048_023229 [Dryococelus australis]|uniref:Uncharacterized protein n=1 Tax=Dryococelus australis TaxID=614101 RepID=A0ABQ9GTL9_9NEOP|nr:hypothetical protein PR048_023229 [Dryococelus australis]